MHDIERIAMSGEAELIKKIDEHMEEASGRYGLELADCDLRVIRSALYKTIQVKPKDKDIGFGNMVLSCPTCGEPVTNYYAPGVQPLCCQSCGQRLKKVK